MLKCFCSYKQILQSLIITPSDQTNDGISIFLSLAPSRICDHAFVTAIGGSL